MHFLRPRPKISSDKRSQRDPHDDHLKQEKLRVYDENYSVYGIRKVCRQLQREVYNCYLPYTLYERVLTPAPGCNKIVV